MRSQRVVRTATTLANSPRVLFAIALLARLRIAYQLVPTSAWHYFYGYNEFARIAWAVVTGHGYSSPWPNTPLLPTAVEPPVYSYLLVGIFKLAGVYSYASLWIGSILNAVFSALTAVLILKLGKRDFGVLSGILAAWVWATWMYEATVAMRLWEGSLSALLLAVALLLLPKVAESARISIWLWFGVLAGVAALTNTTLLSLFPFFWLLLWVRCRRDGRPCNKFLLASVAACLITLLPWTVRNYATFHRLIPLRDNFGLELWIGNREGAGHEFPHEFPAIDPTEYNRMGEISFMEAKRQLAFQFIGQHSGEFMRLSWRRCLKYWTAPPGTAWWAVSILAWAGVCAALWRKRLAAAPYGVVLLVYPWVYYITHTFSNYRHPTEAVMLLLAAYAAVTAAETVGYRWFRAKSA